MKVTEGLRGSVVVRDTPADVAEAAANRIIEWSGAAISNHQRFTIALAGGSTPQALYQLLSLRTGKVDFADWEVFFGDERACPPDDPRSNYAMVKQTLLDRTVIKASNVYRMRGESPNLTEAAAEYSDTLRSVLSSGDSPQMDCVLLGLGENGHTASLFPGDPSLDVVDRWCTPARADYEPFDRLALTFPAINSAKNVAFLVTGENKRQALQDVLAGTAPAARVNPTSGQLHWVLDAAAAMS